MKRTDESDLLNSIIQKEASIDATSFVGELESSVKKVFPDSYVSVSYGAFGKESINISVLLGKDKSEWVNGISQNDPLNFSAWCHDCIDDNGNMKDTITIEFKGASLSIKSDNPMLAFGRVKIPVRKKSGTPEEVLKHIVQMAEKAKQIIKQNLDKMTDQDKKIAETKV